MLKNYFRIAIRNIAGNKVFAAINIIGLAIGIAASLILFIVIKYELSYDKFQANYHSIHHVVTRDKYSDGLKYNPGIPIPALEALRLDIPQVKIGALNASYGSQVTILGKNANDVSTEKNSLKNQAIFLVILNSFGYLISNGYQVQQTF